MDRVSPTSRCICSTSASTRVEAPLAAQAGEEREPQLAVVEVAVEVEQVGLDEHAAAGHEGRADAHVGRRRPPAPLAVLLDRGAAGVDAVARVDERVLRHQVGGREAELAPALVAVLDDAAELERRAEEAVGLLEVAGHHEAADVGRGDDLAVDLHQRHHARLEGGLRAQQVGVALGLVAEAEVLPHRHLRGAELGDQDVVDELLRPLGGERAVERDHHELAHAEPGDQVGLDLQRGQELRRGVRARRPGAGAARRSGRCPRPGSPRGGRGGRRRTPPPPHGAGGSRRRGAR